MIKGNAVAMGCSAMHCVLQVEVGRVCTLCLRNQMYSWVVCVARTKHSVATISFLQEMDTSPCNCGLDMHVPDEKTIMASMARRCVIANWM